MENFEIVDGVLVAYSGKEENVVVPTSVTRIGKEAFKENLSIKSVTIPLSVTEIGESAFELCENLVKVQLPSSLKKIEALAFSECTSLSDVNIPLDIEEINAHAFFDCRIKEVTLGPKFDVLGLLAFGGYNNLVSSFNVSKDNKRFSSVDGVLYNKDKTTLIMYPQRKYVDCFTPLSSVNKIYDYAFTSLGVFGEDKKLLTIKLNDEVKTKGSIAFFEDIYGVNLYLPSNVEEIGEKAFDSFGIVNDKCTLHVEKGSKTEDLLKKDNVCYITY